MRHRLTPDADQDVDLAIDASYDMFGERQALQYSDLIAKAIELAAADPERPGSQARPDIGEHVRSFHVGLAARRRSAAAHVIFYSVGVIGGEEELVVLRVLHQSMEPVKRIATALVDEQPAKRS